MPILSAVLYAALVSDAHVYASSVTVQDWKFSIPVGLYQGCCKMGGGDFQQEFQQIYPKLPLKTTIDHFKYRYSKRKTELSGIRFKTQKLSK